LEFTVIAQGYTTIHVLTFSNNIKEASNTHVQIILGRFELYNLYSKATIGTQTLHAITETTTV